MGDLLAYLWHHLFTWWGYLVLVGGSLLELGWLYVVVLRAYDVEYDEKECAESYPRIDLKKALRRRLSVPRLGLPLWLAFAVMLAVWFSHMNLHTYVTVAFFWFLTTPLRKMLGIAVARKAHRDSEKEQPETSYWDDVVYYYSWAFDTVGAKGQFKRRLRWMNAVLPLLRLLMFWRLWGMALTAAASFFWPVAALCSMFYHIEMVDDYHYLQPWWRWNRKGAAPERKHKVVDGEVVKTDPADDDTVTLPAIKPAQ